MWITTELCGRCGLNIVGILYCQKNGVYLPDSFRQSIFTLICGTVLFFLLHIVTEKFLIMISLFDCCFPSSACALAYSCESLR